MFKQIIEFGSFQDSSVYLFGQQHYLHCTTINDKMFFFNNLQPCSKICPFRNFTKQSVVLKMLILVLTKVHLYVCTFLFFTGEQILLFPYSDTPYVSKSQEEGERSTSSVQFVIFFYKLGVLWLGRGISKLDQKIDWKMITKMERLIERLCQKTIKIFGFSQPCLRLCWGKPGLCQIVTIAGPK